MKSKDLKNTQKDTAASGLLSDAGNTTTTTTSSSKCNKSLM